MAGLWQAEVLALRWQCVGIVSATLRVRRALQRIEVRWRFVKSKSKRSARTHSLPDGAVAALRAQRVWQPEERLAPGESWKDLDHLFETPKGTPLEPSNFNGRLHRLLEVCGMHTKWMHSLPIASRRSRWRGSRTL